MVFRFGRKPRQPHIEIPEIHVPEIEVPKVERDDVTRLVRRAAVYVVPAILTFAFFTFVAWTIRRRLVGLSDESAIQPIIEEVVPVEPAYEIPA